MRYLPPKAMQTVVRITERNKMIGTLCNDGYFTERLTYQCLWLGSKEGRQAGWAEGAVWRSLPEFCFLFLSQLSPQGAVQFQKEHWITCSKFQEAM